MSLPPGTRRRQQQLAHWVRRTPGYRAVTSTVLPRVRGSVVLTDLVWRVLSPRHGAGEVLMPLHGGRYLTGPGVDRLPVVGVLATGLSGPEAEALVEQVAALQREQASFRPLLILDQPVFAAARAHGYVLEHLVPEEVFAAGDHGGTGDGGDGAGWGAYLGTRLAQLRHHYQLWHLARGGPHGLDPVDEQVVRALAARLPEDLEVSVLDDDDDAPDRTDTGTGTGTDQQGDR
ncbi:hypothetical protein ACI3EY_00890 [Ornithinimicrobium sp. LYQ92]|uniref:hypothetical protein n=1 Tax=Serinicoccus sp. LYQ92 TaxID=3378798 RepID=UPI003853C8E1